VIIVWQDGDTIYRPTTISSRQVHVAFVIKAVSVEEDPNETYYRYASPLHAHARTHTHTHARTRTHTHTHST
jgi:hypothetical protein